MRPRAGHSGACRPFLRGISLALLALVLVGMFLWSTPTEAQTTTVLVKNTGQASNSGVRALSSTFSKRAQALTTGPNAEGYSLNSIGFLFHTISNTSTAGSQLTVTLNEADSSGNPGTALCTLTDPESFSGAGVQTFSAPTAGPNLCPTLAANTTYSAVIERVVSTSDNIFLKATTSSNEHAGGAAGWSIGNDLHYVSAGSWVRTASQSYQIEVKGAVGTEVAVPRDWTLKPTGLNTGDKFRLLFLTPAGHSPTSTEIADYNTYVQGRAAAGHADIQAYSNRFRVVGSTADTDARDNTGTTYTASDTGVPIYWLNGNKVADDYEDFYDGTWDDEANPRTRAGATTSPGLVWTGSKNDGTEAFNITISRAFGGAPGASVKFVRAGRLNGSGGPLDSEQQYTTSTSQPYYALSGVFVVSAQSDYPATGAPTTSGVPRVGERLTADTSGISDAHGTASATFRYQWVRVDGTVGTDISGATSSTYTLRPDDAGKRIKVKVSFTDDAGNAEGPLSSLLTDAVVSAVGFVQNTGQASSTSAYSLDATFSKRAQAFTTGSDADGYTVNSIGFQFNAIGDTSTAGSQLRATLNAESSGGNPGTALCTLTDPESFSAAGVQTFDAPPTTGTSPCPTLAANTTYFAVIERVVSTPDIISLKITTISSEDAGSEAGWTIGNDRHRKSPEYWITSTSSSHQIEVKGTVATGVVVPRDWTLKPTGLNTGDKFRLLFLTPAGYSPTSTEIADYNTYVQGRAAAGHADILAYSNWFRVVGSTADTDARDNTGTTYTASEKGVPIYWLNGNKVADDYEDFYDGTWDNEANPRTRAGATTSPGLVWTGSKDDGKEAFSSTFSRAFGAPVVRTGRLNGSGGPLDAGKNDTTSTSHPYYALSGVFVVSAQLVNPATGAPTISGVPRVGERLTADTSGISDANGIASATFRYQWVRLDGTVGTDISGATSSSYTLRTEDAGKKIKVKVRFTDYAGNAEGPLHSLLTDAVVAAEVLVQNTGQYSDGFVTTLSSTYSKRAQEFTTGSNAEGYSLNSIGFLFHNISNTSTAGSQLTVTLNAESSDGNPGAALCTLTDPESFSAAGVHTFRVSTTITNLCPTLAANTTYFAVIERVVVTSDTISLKSTTSSSEDVGRAPGWSIGNDRRYRGAVSWFRTAAQPHQIDVRGPGVSIIANQATVTEGDTATFTLTRTGSATRTEVVNVSVSDPGSYLRGNHWQPDPVLPTTATFQVGSSTATISLQTKDDLRDIPDNNLTVTISSGTGHLTVGDANSASIVVTDNDVAPTLTLSSDSTSVEEGETFVLNLNITGGSETSLPLDVDRGYQGQVMSETVTLDASGDQRSWSVATDDNDLDEQDRVYSLEIPLANDLPDAVSEYLNFQGSSSISVTVRDNDLPQVYVEALESSYSELETGKFKISRIGLTDEALVINANASQAGNDVHATSQHLLGAVGGDPRTWTIEASKESVTVDFRLSGLDGDEDNGFVTMAILSGDLYRVDPQRSAASFRVVDADPEPVISVQDVSAAEDGGYLQFTVLFDAANPSRRAVSVIYTTRDGTATSLQNADFTPASGILTVSPGVTSAIISVPVNDDSLPEPNEDFTLTLLNPINATLAGGLITIAATGTILDDEPMVTIAPQDTVVEEGEPAVFLFQRTGSVDRELTVYAQYSLDIGTEQINGEALTVIFPAGDRQTTWSYATEGDYEDESDFVITAWLRDPEDEESPWPYHSSAEEIAKVTVEDDDAPLVTIKAVHSDRTEGQDVRFTLTREGVLSDELTISISATGAASFISGARPTTVTFDEGNATADLTVATVDDDPVDPDALLVVAIFSINLDDYRVGDPGSATVALYDSDAYRPEVSIEAYFSVVTEGDNVNFVLRRSSYDSDESLTVQVQVTVTTGRASSLYDGVTTAVSDQEVVFDADSRTAFLTVPTVDEDLNDGNSSVEALIKSGQYSIRPYPGEAIVWVKDDDVPTVTVTPETGEVLENPPNGTEFTVVRTGDTTDFLRLKVVTWYDRRWPDEVLSPPVAADHERERTPRTGYGGIQDFLPGEASNTFRRAPRATGPLGTTSYVEVLPIYCPDVIPGDCGYRPQYQVGSPKSSTIEVLNRDMGVRVVADQASVDEGDAATFTLHRYGGSSLARVLPLTVRVQVTQNGDFIDGVLPQTVTFSGTAVDEVNDSTPEGATSAVITIPTDDDMMVEGDGAITLTILDPDPELYGTNVHSYEVVNSENFLADSGWASVATVEVLNDDRSGFSIADASANEADGSLQFTATLESNPLETSVDWATEEDAEGDHPATEGVDYPAASGTLTFSAGVTSQTFPVRVTDDDLSEHHETFLVRLSNPVKATLTDAVATGTITDDDRVSIEVGVSSSEQTLTVPEGGSNTYEVVLGHQPTGDVTVTVTVDDTANNDVTTEEGSLVFTTANWNEPKTVTVRAAEDDDAVTDDDVTISHSVSGANYEGVTVPGLTVTITENDAVGVTIAPTSLTVVEGRSNSYLVKLNSQPTADVTVAISGHSGTALTLSGTALTNDYLTFTSSNWNTPQTVTVTAGTVTTDTDVTLVHGISSGDYDSVTASDVVVTIVDIHANQVTIQVGVSSSEQNMTVPEGGSNTYEVVLGHQPTGDVTVTVTVDDTANNDVTTEERSLVFTTANWNDPKTVTVRAAEDDDAVTDDDVAISHTAGGANYEGVTVPALTVTITEDDVVGVSIDPTTLTVTEGSSSSYTVALTSEPAGDVTIAISGHADTDLTLSGTALTSNELTFTASNWSTAQTVTVKAAEDGDAVQDDDVALAHAIRSADDPAYDALADQTVTVSITEKDAVGVSIDPTDLTVRGGRRQRRQLHGQADL